MEAAKFAERQAIFPKDVAETMIRMVENSEGRYEGGSCVLKTAGEERIVEEGWRAEGTGYDPSPRPDPDIHRVRSALDKERGVQWSAN